MSRPNIVDRELASILAGLRLLQRSDRIPLDIDEIRSDDGYLEPLDIDEVDELCVRLNCAPRSSKAVV